jgi:hypothetical protein
MGKTQAPAKGKRGAAAGKVANSKVQVNKFANQSQLDFPLRTYEDIGRKLFHKLTEQKSKKGAKKLSGYELYLLQTYFPSLEKKYIAAQTKADAKRKEARRSANKRIGLVEEAVFSRKKKEVLLQKLSTSS